jgi:dipeptidyl aminopeptidase/acylaminoacyl peptidase
MMPGVIRYAAGGLCVAVLVFSAIVGTAAGDVPGGPRLAYARDGQSLKGEELLTTNPLATRPFLIYRHPHAHKSFQHLSWSGSGTRLTFASHGYGFGERIYTLKAGGGAPREVTGTRFGFAPVFSPDGRTIAFARRFFWERSDGTVYLSVSPWRDGLLISPSSFSPDGTSLLAESLPKQVEHPPEIVSVPLDGGPPSPILEDGAEPAYSPDGTAIAFIRPHDTGRLTRFGYSVPGGDLYVSDPGEPQPTRLTFTPNRRESHPSWDPSGERLAFIQSPAKPTLAAQRRGTGGSVMEINADGSCRHRLLFTRGLAYREAIWQPGPGRGAGPIAC